MTPGPKEIRTRKFANLLPSREVLLHRSLALNSNPLARRLPQQREQIEFRDFLPVLQRPSWSYPEPKSRSSDRPSGSLDPRPPDKPDTPR